LIFCRPKIREYRVISGVAAETKLLLFIPRFLEYHSVVLGTEATVRTRWSRDLIVAAGVDIFLVVVINLLDETPAFLTKDVRRNDIFDGAYKR
jgi:hypothetical protein